MLFLKVKKKIFFIGFLLLSMNNISAAVELSAADSTVLQKFFNQQEASANFVQIGPKGQRSQGAVYLQRPGKIRFIYDNSPLEIVADGKSVAVHNTNLNNWSLYNINQTPLRFLLEKDFQNIMQKVNKTRTTPDAKIFSFVDSSKFGGKLDLYFDKKTQLLKKWVVIDTQNLKTTVILSNFSPEILPDKNLFRIPYQDIAMQRKDR